jgi:C1A family cysteine protease
LARLQLYYDERKMEGTIKSDAGAEIRDGIKCAAKLGVAHETLWPYNIKKFTSQPSARVYKDALSFKALTYERVEVDANALRNAIALGHTPVIGVSLYSSFESNEVATSGMVPMPGRSEQDVGGHCLYVVGYGQRPGYFTVRNSWGTSWGAAGDCFFPDSYLGSKLLGSDYWIVKSEGAAK